MYRNDSTEGHEIEFRKDGTIYDPEYDTMNPLVYEVVDKNTIKLGEYDTSWLQYEYMYFKMDYSRNRVILTSQEEPGYILRFEK